jgi:hypothetical protein
MTLSGRSLDDQPLAAYSRRGSVNVGDDEPEEPVHASVPWHDPDEATATAPAALALGTLDEPMVPSDATPADAVIRLPKPALGPLRDFVRARPRLVAGAGFVVVILFGLVLLGGGAALPGAAGTDPSPSAPAVVPVAAEPGSATLVLTGSVKATYTLTGNAGQPAAADSAVAGLWTDSLQNMLKLDGPVDRGTRTTDAGFVLTWALMVEGELVTFTSSAGECTIGMAVNPSNVSGSFSCHKLKSDDGKLTVGASGTYRT